MKSSIYVAVMTCFLGLSVAAVGASATDMGQLVVETCSPCHTTKRICLNLGVKSQVAWKSTIQNMVYQGAELNEDQIAPLATYLNELQPGTPPVCD